MKTKVDIHLKPSGICTFFDKKKCKNIPCIKCSQFDSMLPEKGNPIRLCSIRGESSIGELAKLQGECDNWNEENKDSIRRHICIYDKGEYGNRIKDVWVCEVNCPLKKGISKMEEKNELKRKKTTNQKNEKQEKPKTQMCEKKDTKTILLEEIKSIIKNWSWNNCVTLNELENAIENEYPLNRFNVPVKKGCTIQYVNNNTLIKTVFDQLPDAFPRIGTPRKEKIENLSNKVFTINNILELAYSNICEQDKKYPDWMRYKTEDIPNRYSLEKKEKPRSRVRDMMRRDRLSCFKRDKKLAELGIKKECKDLIRDNPCNGCTFAMEADREGPFDPPFVCAGISRIKRSVNEALAHISVTSDSYIAYKRISDTHLLKAQIYLSKAIELISRVMSAKSLECVNDSRGKRPECYIAIETLENYLKK